MHTIEQIKSDLKNKKYSPIYYLMGEEPYFIDEITEQIEENVLPKDQKAFNLKILYGKDADMPTLLNEARRYPMMADYNVVILKEAQELKGIDGLSTDQKDPFLLYVENAPPTTILVINLKGKKLDKRKKLYKALDKKGVLFESKPLYDSNVGAWITSFAKSKGYAIDAKAAELMASHLGTDLSLIVKEFDKLFASIPNTQKITVKEIEEHVGIHKEFNVFELQKALGTKNVYKANLIVVNLSKNPKTASIIPLITLLYSFFTKILMVHSSADKSRNNLASLLSVNPYFVQDYLNASRNYTKMKCVHIIGFLREYDTKSKGIDSPDVSDFELMRELIYKILHI